MNINKLHALNVRFPLFVLVLLCLTFPASLSAQCPNQIAGFDYLGELNNHKYYISQDKEIWETANSITLSNGGYLTSINTADENDFIFQQAQLLGISEKVHIGLNDVEIENIFVWPSGEPITFDNGLDLSFSGTENNNVSMNLWQGGGGWNVENKWVDAKFILELPCDELIPESDVEILSYSCPAEFPLAGNTISFNITVRNQGTVPSLPQTFGFYQSIIGDDPIADDLLGQAYVGTLAPNEIAVIPMNNVFIPDPFYFPGFLMNNTQWGPFYVKRFNNSSGTSLGPDNTPLFDIFCQTYTTDIAVSFDNPNNEFGDEGIVEYEGYITNNGPATAYNIKVIVGETAYGSIPSIFTVPYENILTFDDGTKMICIDELAAGASVLIDVYYDFDNVSLPDTFEASIIAYSEHLVDTNNPNNTATELFIFNPNVSDDCPNFIAGYQYLGQYNSNRYFISDILVHWWEADSLAAEVGGELTAIETETENLFLFGYLDESAWVGMSDFENEEEFVWSNGEPNLYDNIQGANGANLDYVSINHWNGDWVLNKPLNKKKFVIEVPCNEVPGSFADLTGTILDIGATSGAQETSVDFTFSLLNEGNSDAANEYISKVYLSADTILSPDDPKVGELTTGFTGQGTETIVEMEAGIAIPWNLLLGEYYVIVALDCGEIIPESNEINNIFVSSQTLEVTGDLCTILPNVEEGNMTIYGIPNGNSYLQIYGPAFELEESYTCFYDCDSYIEIPNFPDGVYNISFYYFDDNFNEICHTWLLEITIVDGTIAGMIEDSETEFETTIHFDPTVLVSVSNHSLYPNPANEYIIASIESFYDTEAQLEIYDINGRKSISKTLQIEKGVHPVELDINNLSSGIHHLVIKSENQVLSTQRFIKK